jgi:hypothetical protein
MKHPEIASIFICKLRPNSWNARTHSERQIQQIASSIQRWQDPSANASSSQRRVTGFEPAEIDSLMGD